MHALEFLDAWQRGVSGKAAHRVGVVMFDTGQSMRVGCPAPGSCRVTARLYDGTAKLADGAWDFIVASN